jgi:hypothetical protein
VICGLRFVIGLEAMASGFSQKKHHSQITNKKGAAKGALFAWRKNSGLIFSSPPSSLRP